VLTSKEIRQSFIDFFLQQGHTFVPSSAVVPREDPTLLFTNAGMNQFKDIFLGSERREYSRAVNSQKCIRVSGKHNDLEEVGNDTYHHTFFEMLGNWSFGDYFKAEAISWAWKLLTDVWQIPSDKLWVTVFGGDTADGLDPDLEAEKLWPQQCNIPAQRVLRFGRKDNFWEMGDVGPCGPCSEIHLDMGPEQCDKKNDPKHICQVNGDCGRFIELWNLVFIQYNRDEKGQLSQLPATHVDTGAGLERVVAVLQNKKSNYDTDLFVPLLQHLEQISGQSYTQRHDLRSDTAFRVIADHVRTLTFAITDGASPSNEGRGYVLRRILRRAARYGLLLDLHQPFIHQLVPTLVDVMGQAYPELPQRAEHAANVIKAEEESFCRTLGRGIEIFEADLAQLAKTDTRELPGEKVFRLYDTYGFPVDLTQLMAQERGLNVDLAGFDKLMNEQRARARASQRDVVYEADALSHRLPKTLDDHKYHRSTVTARLLGYVQADDYITEGTVPANTEVGLVFDSTCAYAEAGGQVGDHGAIVYNAHTFTFENTQAIGDAVVHIGKTTSDQLPIGAEMTITVDPAREDTRKNHTATHLLQWALQRVLGTHVHQEGSLVCDDYLRFDFTHPRSVTTDQIEKIEHLVRQKIDEALPVTFKVVPIDEGRKLGAMALFSEKYGDHVRVLAIGAPNPDRLEEAFSREFCGGTHVTNTRDIGGFKIQKEESVATGVRRITALTGRHLNRMLYQRSNLVENLTSLLKTTPDRVADRIQTLLDENKRLSKQLKKGSAADLKSATQQLFDQAQSFGDSKLIAGALPSAPVDAIRTQIDWLRNKAPSSVIVLASENDKKALLFAAVTDDLIPRSIKAGDIVRHIAPIVGGGGGGRPQMAQAGGKKPENIDDALQAARDFVTQKLT